MRASPWTLACALLLALVSPAAQALVLAVNEGVSYRVPNEEVRGRYAAIATDLSRILKQPVTVEPVGDYASLRRGLTAKDYDLALVHPAHVSIQAIKLSGYRLVAVTQGFENYQAQFLVRADSPLQSLADLKGKRLGAPDEDSITAVMVRATLRDAGLDARQVELVYTRYQDAVPFFVENRLTTAGATAAEALVKDWTGKGNRVLAKSRPVPIKHVIASPRLSAQEVESVRDYLVSLGASEEGRRKLAPTHYRGFDRFDQAAMLSLGSWLGL